METLYRKVAVSERLPEKFGFYFIISVNGVQKNYWFNGIMFFVDENVSVKYWLEPIKSDNSQYAAGCKVFTGGEIKHHKDCHYYPESFTEMYEKLEAEKKELLEALEKVKKWGGEFGMDYQIYKEIESLIQKHKQ